MKNRTSGADVDIDMGVVLVIFALAPAPVRSGGNKTMMMSGVDWVVPMV